MGVLKFTGWGSVKIYKVTFCYLFGNLFNHIYTYIYEFITELFIINKKFSSGTFFLINISDCFCHKLIKQKKQNVTKWNQGKSLIIILNSTQKNSVIFPWLYVKDELEPKIKV